MAKAKRKGSMCRKVKRGRITWYCCCGKIKPGFPGAGKVRCHCAPMVGKNAVDMRHEVRFEIGKDGKARRIKAPKRRR